MKTIHIFDLDDTLFKTPKLADFISEPDNQVINDNKYFSNWFSKIKRLFLEKLNKKVSFIKKGDFIVPINSNNLKSFNSEIIDYFNDSKQKKFFDSYDGILVINSFPGFHSYPETLGQVFNNKTIKKYKKVPNKMIITGRKEELRGYIIEIFKNLNLELPNYGLILYNNDYNSIKDYKTDIILQTIELNKWDKVHFYEDRPDWLYHAEGAVNEKFPNVKFISHLITNVKNNMKM